MAIPAIDAVIADVVGVAELHGLRANDARFGHIGRSHDNPGENQSADNEPDRPENAHASDRIHARVENLRHEWVPSVNADWFVSCLCERISTRGAQYQPEPAAKNAAKRPIVPASIKFEPVRSTWRAARLGSC
jgi:hypothetical protein